MNYNKIMKVKVLGTTSPYCKGSHNGPSFLVFDDTHNIMLDCGSGSHRLLNMNKDLNNLSIILSHLHKDHFSDIFNIMYSANTFYRLGLLKEEINVYLPEKPLETYNFIKNELINHNKFYKITKNLQLNIDNFFVEFLKVEHAKDYDCYAIKITKNNKKIVYTGDLNITNLNKLKTFAKNCDLLVCEASILPKHNVNNSFHLTAKEAGLIAKECNAKKLLLTHFWPEDNPEEYVLEAKQVFNNTFAASEEDIYEI